ncbi:MAG: hypothetical protein M1831_007372 [Alyxoria varia]|nr:MAG: hypothetical protein M1831_007372 [Alyxoria varia]
MANKQTFKINFLGDVMLGRLIDQLLPTSVHEPSEAQTVRNFAKSNPAMNYYSATSPWGTALPLLLEADLNIINLETSATTSASKWPDKVFNYRMHPANVEALKPAKIDYAGLANNHTLDFREAGLADTVKTLRKAAIAFAGAGDTRAEALQPARLKLPRGSGNAGHDVLVWSASDHPQEWGKVPQFHLIDYSSKVRSRLKDMLCGEEGTKDMGTKTPPLKVFSVHWGPNYSWEPANEIHSLAHWLVDECGVDIIHGHSSHHVQGVEKYKDSVIIYGCGDFVDDYALVADYRNDLSAVWRVSVVEEGVDTKPRIEKLEVFPTKIKQFQACRLEQNEADHEWVRDKIVECSKKFDMGVSYRIGDAGQLVFYLA